MKETNFLNFLVICPIIPVFRDYRGNDWLICDFFLLAMVYWLKFFRSEVKSLSVSDSLWVHAWSSLPGSSVRGIFQARVLEWVAISFSRGSSQLSNQTQVFRIVGRCFTIWATREVQNTGVGCLSRLQGIIPTQADSLPTELSEKPNFPGGSDSKSVCLQCGRPGFNPWVGKIPWGRKWQPTPELLAGKFHGS